MLTTSTSSSSGSTAIAGVSGDKLSVIKLGEVHPYFGLAGSAENMLLQSTTIRLLVAPLTIPSNNCIMLILSYTCGREDATKKHEFNRICKRALYLFNKPSTRNFFNLAPLKVVLNQWTDPVNFFTSGKIHSLARNHTLRLSVNVPLESIAHAV